LEIQSGKGRLLASEMCLEAAKADPIARRLLENILGCLNNKQGFPDFGDMER